MFRRMNYILFIICSLLFSQDLVLSGGSDYETKPGEILTVPVMVTNGEKNEKRFVSKIEGPSYFRSIIPPLPFKIAAGQSQVELISLKIDNNVPPGNHTIRYIVEDMDGYLPPSETQFTVSIEENLDLEVTNLSDVDYVFAGKQCETEFMIRNLSNKAVKLKATITGSEKVQYDREALKSLSLEPGKAIKIPVQFSPGSYRRGNYRFQITLDVNGDVRSSCRKSILVIDDSREARWRKLPLLLTCNTTFNPEDSTFSWEPGLYVQGAIDKAQKFYIEGQYFSLRHELNPFDEFFVENEPEFFQPSDRFFINFRSPSLDITLGDYSTTFSRLVTRQSLRGIHSGVKAGILAFEGYYQDKAWLSTNQRFYMGKVGIDVSGNRLLIGSTVSGVDTLRRTMTLDYQGNFTDMLNLSLELATNMDESFTPALNLNDGGIAVDVSGSGRFLTHRTSAVLSGENFSDVYQKQSSLTTNAVIKPWKKLHLNPSAYYERSVSDDTDYPVRYGGQFMARFSPFSGSYLGIGVDIEFADDLGNNTARQDFASLSLSQNFRILAMKAVFEQGRFVQNNDIVQNGITRLSADLGVNPFRALSFSLYGRLRKNDMLNSTSPNDLTAGGRMSLNICKAIRLHSSYAVELNPDNLSTERMLAQAGIQTTLWHEQHTLDLNITYEEPEKGNRRYELRGQYRIPVGIPISRNTSGYSISGTVKAGDQPVKDVGININGRSVQTDRNGLFRMEGLEKGRCFVDITLPDEYSDFVLEDHRLLEFRLVKDVKDLKLNLVPAAEISGNIMTFEFPKTLGKSDTSLVETGPLSGATVNIIKSDLRKELLTDDMGNFHFKGLEPGKWSVELDESSISEGVMAKGTGTFDIAQGEKKIVDIEIIPEKTEIEMILPEKTLKKK